MKKQHIFTIMIVIIFYIAYLIVNFLIKEYRINSDIEYIRNLINEIEKNIEETKNTIEYKTSVAYKNKILKEQQNLKNIWEDVILFTTEERFNKYTTLDNIEEKKEIIETIDDYEINLTDFSIYEKWNYFLFRKIPK